MPDLYLVWAGVEFGSNAPLFGTRCGTSLPYFEQPQTRLHPDCYASGIALAALPDRILCLFSGSDTANKVLGVGGEDEWLASAICQQWPSWPQVQPGAGLSLQSASMWPPSIAPFGTGAVGVWSGVRGDTRVWCSQYNRAENVWSSQYLTALAGAGKPIQCGTGPAVVNFDGMLLMVWVGEGNNDLLYYATSHDGRTWMGNKSIPGAASSTSPALAIFNGAPVLCFKGIAGDGGIYSSTYHVNSDSWAPVVPTGPFGTSASPTLAVYQGKLFMAWKGTGGDTDLYWSITNDNLNRSAWSGQANISNAGSSFGPAAVVF